MGALFFFGWLSGEVLRGQTRGFDLAVRQEIHGWASPRLTYAMRGITLFGSTAAIGFLSLLLLWQLVRTGRRRAAVLLIIAAVGAMALNQALKLIFRRTRPEPFFGYALPHSYSFPSGHSIISCCFYGVVAAILTVTMRSRAAKAATWAAAAVMTLLVGLSRIYLGVHHASDVLAGYAAAVIWVGAVRAGYEIWRRRRGGFITDSNK